jgi:2-aminoethylphosphonate-pyruvate transaminase
MLSLYSSVKNVLCKRNMSSYTKNIKSNTVMLKYGLSTSHNPFKSLIEQDKLLFTPGPLTTSHTVKSATLKDLGSRDETFINIIKDIQNRLHEVANISKEKYTSVFMQGSGTFGVESCLDTVVDKKKGVFLIANGAYGLRQTLIVKSHNIPYILYEINDDQYPSLEIIESYLKTTAKDCSHVSMVHSETTSGLINDIESVGKLCHKYNKSFIVDAMSSFGGVLIDFERSHIDYLISSSNKCIEGIPGFSFVIANKEKLKASKGNATSLSLDLEAQHLGFEKQFQFRFTPPVHSMLAFQQALKELKDEGGISVRQQRYMKNQKILTLRMKKLNFKTYLTEDKLGHIITSYLYLNHTSWNFNKFYQELNKLGFVIYPGKISNADCFRIGHIGRIFDSDIEALCNAIEKVCNEMMIS